MASVWVPQLPSSGNQDMARFGGESHCPHLIYIPTVETEAAYLYHLVHIL